LKVFGRCNQIIGVVIFSHLPGLAPLASWVSEPQSLKRGQVVSPSSRDKLRILEPRANFSPRPIICSIGSKNTLWVDVENLEDKLGAWG